MGVWCRLRFLPRIAALAVTGLLLTGALTSFPGVDPEPGSGPERHGGTAVDGIQAGPFFNLIDQLDSAQGNAGRTVATALRAIADAHDIPVGERDACPGLDQAIALHAERLGVPAPNLPIFSAPPELDEALACLLYAVHQSNRAMDRTFQGLSTPELIALFEAATERRPLTPELLALLDDRDHTHNLVAAIHAAEAVDHAIPLLEGLKASGRPLPPLDVEPILRFTPEGDAEYENNYALIVDLEGNDAYDNHAGGVFLAMGSAIYDVEDGSAYQEVEVLGDTISIGGNTQDAETVISSSMVLDMGGSDTYGFPRAPILKDAEQGCTTEDVVPMVATIGSGAIGTGMLFDLDGDDTFTGRTLTQGSGHVLGVGVMYSGGGNDRFQGIRQAQGSGLLGGIGLLINDGGDNVYNMSAPEGGVWNGDLTFCDDDVRYAQGSAFDRRPGPLLPAVGILADRGGDTRYSTVHKSQGFGQGPGLGLLYDTRGHDDYHGVELAQGAAQGRNVDTHPQAPWSSGYAVLFDRQGDDTYTLLGGVHGYRGQGYSLGQAHDEPLPDVSQLIQWALARNEAIGLHLDQGGTDTHQGPPGRDNDAVHVDGVLGLFVNQDPDGGNPE